MERTDGCFRLIAWLLDFPSGQLVDSLPLLREAAADLLGPQAQVHCGKLLGYLGETPLIRLQEVYTATFDLNAQTCLNLTYHQYGDAGERGRALAHLHGMYRDAGFEGVKGELPDYLPMVLEFLSACSPSAGRWIIATYGEAVSSIAAGLTKQKSPYAGILNVLTDMFGRQGE